MVFDDNKMVIFGVLKYNILYIYIYNAVKEKTICFDNFGDYFSWPTPYSWQIKRATVQLIDFDFVI